MMQQPVQPTEIAQRLLASIAREAQGPEEIVDAAQVAYQRLRERLGLLLGQRGFDALWARALHEAQTEARPQDQPIDEVAPAAIDGGLHALVHGRNAAATGERLCAVFAACIQLLYTFIGQDLSFRLLQRIWPDVGFGEPQVRGDESNL
jgi:hypothetical protein